jgi:hypothetical protein
MTKQKLRKDDNKMLKVIKKIKNLLHFH